MDACEKKLPHLAWDLPGVGQGNMTLETSAGTMLTPYSQTTDCQMCPGNAMQNVTRVARMVAVLRLS